MALPLVAAKPAPAPKPAAAPSAPTSSQAKAEEKAHTAAFAEYESQMATGQKSRAADALVVVLDDSSKAQFHAEAAAKLGDLLKDLNLPYAALTAYVQAFLLADDTNSADIGTRVPTAIELAQKVGDIAILEEPFSKNVGLARTDDQRGQMAYLAARESMRQGSYGLALGILKLVKQADEVYPEAKVLEGVILNQQSRQADALVAFEAAQKAGRSKDQRFKDMLLLNVGRSFYGATNYPRAVQAFAAVPRESEFWPEAQFERAWAHFRLSDFNGTLGVLYTLETPFFADYYFPEADLLRIYSMFYLCKFPEANTSIEDFKAKYKSLYDKLVAWGSKTPEENFAAARVYAEKGTVGELPEAVLRPFKQEDRFLASVAAVRSAEDELGRLRNVEANPFAARAKQWLEGRRNQLVTEEGKRVKERVGGQEAELGEMLTNSEIFVLDILRMKAMLYDQAAAAGHMLEAAKTADRVERLRKNQIQWPFEGEIWADELGYYQATATADCPASLRSSVGQ